WPMTAVGRDEPPKAKEPAVGKELITINPSDYNLTSMAFSPDGKRIAGAGQEEKTIRLHDATTGKVIRTFEGHPAGGTRVVFGPEGKRVYSAGTAATIRIWDTTTGKEVRTLLQNGPVKALALTPDGKQAASVVWDRLGRQYQIRIWDPETGRTRFLISQ